MNRTYHLIEVARGCRKTIVGLPQTIAVVEKLWPGCYIAIDTEDDLFDVVHGDLIVAVIIPLGPAARDTARLRPSAN